MKRKGNLYPLIYDLDNIRLAEAKARKGKGHQPGVKLFDMDPEANLLAIQEQLQQHTYRTAEYYRFTIFEPKPREISRLPYPDRIVHHSIMNVLEDIFTATFTADTYSCIKGRGIHGASNALKRGLKDVASTQYCLKMDIRKFYPSIDHGIMKGQIRRKIKDPELLELLDGIIDSAPGVPIGNYLSQYFANLYLTGFDHWLKEQLHVRYYYRYADDMVILAPDKPQLHALLQQVRGYLGDKLKLDVKGNYQVFPVAKRGIDFVGYVHYHTHTRLRKSIKQSFARAVAGGANESTTASYQGWAKHADCLHLIKKLNHENLPGTGHQKPGKIFLGQKDRTR